MKLYLINDSEYALFFTLSSMQNSQYKLLKSALVKPNEVMLVGEFARIHVSQLENLLVQVIAHKNGGTFHPQEPINRKLTTRMVKFSKRGSFNHLPQLGCDCMVVDLSSHDLAAISTESTQRINEQYAAALPKSVKSTIKQRRDVPTTPEIVEVDLHIGQLLDTTAGMSSGDILQYQLEYFRSTISQYSRYRGLKLIFIHGKGDGVLRQSILQELKRMGRADRCQEASFKRYGYGALMVVI